MSDAVEIYVCMEGQALKEGKVEYSQSIYDKHAAEQDAQARVTRNPKIHKIAYYRVNAEGDFRIFYSFTNPNLVSNKSTIDQHDKKPRRKKPAKRTWWQKLLGLKGGVSKSRKKKPAKKANKKA